MNPDLFLHCFLYNNIVSESFISQPFFKNGHKNPTDLTFRAMEI